MYRFDLASFTEPRVILITDTVGKRSSLPRLGYVVTPNYSKCRKYFIDTEAKREIALMHRVTKPVNSSVH